MQKNTIELLKLIISLTFPKKKISKGRPDKASIEHYLEVINYVLRTGIQWKELREKLHYTTYHKKFMKWSNANIFSNAHKIQLKLFKAQGYITDKSLQNLFIDSSMIKNIRGVDFKGKNHYDRCKKGNKVTVIVTSKGIPLGIHLAKSNTHDIDLVTQALDNIKLKIIGSRLIADKGYVSQRLKDKLRKDKNIYLVYPKKINQKGKLPDIQRALLKQRNIVENFFSWMMNFRRIRVRYETKISNYVQFYYLAMIEIGYKKILV